MKSHTLILVVLGFLLSCNGFAQRPERGPFESNAFVSSPEEDLVIVAYHVVERINRPLGTYVTTYEVSDISMVSTIDLGANNSRVITPKYGKSKRKIQKIMMASMQPVAKMIISAPVAALPAATVTIDKSPKTAYIDILKTYERILEKNYQSIDMLKRVANSRYFEGNFVIAAKWYDKLFALTQDFEPVLYFRYAEALKAINQTAKANEMMRLYEHKDKEVLTSSR